ncbi:MAG: hypothetical protein IKW38_05555 [Kiritimatiellae bacterium]|nr:hypothetical protein [Kiritimatiellia bacterium]
MEMVMVGGMPDARDVALFRAQYQKAVNGLYEAYLFGVMLQKVKAALEAQGEGLAQGENGDEMGASPEASPGSLTRENARLTQPHGGSLAAGGWNAGMGLKGWLAKAAPEVNYKTAMRFLAVAEKVDEVLPAGSDEGLVRDYLAGKSARSLLGGKREGAGRKRKDYAAALGAAPEVAWKEIEEPLAALNELIVVQARHAVLTAADRQTLLGALQMLLETVEGDK